MLHLVDDDRSVHPKAVAKGGPLLLRRNEVDHHPNPLFFNP